MQFDNFCKHNDIDYTVVQSGIGFYPRGFVFKKPNGMYHIILNGNHCVEQLKKTLIHEIIHVIEGHLDKDVSFRDIVENEAEQIIQALNIRLAY